MNRSTRDEFIYSIIALVILLNWLAANMHF